MMEKIWRENLHLMSSCLVTLAKTAETRDDDLIIQCISIILSPKEKTTHLNSWEGSRNKHMIT
jgi:hypothetical protein